MLNVLRFTNLTVLRGEIYYCRINLMFSNSVHHEGHKGHEERLIL